MNNKVEVSALILTIGEQEIKLTLYQARELLSALRNALEPAQKPVTRMTLGDLFDLKRPGAVEWTDPKLYVKDAENTISPRINTRLVEEMDSEGRITASRTTLNPTLGVPLDGLQLEKFKKQVEDAISDEAD